MQSITLTDTQSVIVTANPVDAEGAPGVLLAGAGDTPPSSSDPAVATVSEDPANHLSLKVVAVAPGTTIVTGRGASPSGAVFSDPFQVTVTGGPAVGFNYTFGTPFTTPTAP